MINLTTISQKIFGDMMNSSKDGSASLTRLAAITAHLLAAGFFVYHNLKTGFNEILWITYLGFATGHAIWDKAWMTTKGKNLPTTVKDETVIKNEHDKNSNIG